MSLFSRKGLGVLVLVVLALLAALYGMGNTISRPLTPANNAGAFLRIHADGWIEDGSEIRFANLLSRGNRLKLQFVGWRPSGIGDAHIRVHVCGERAAEFFVSQEQRIFEVPLRGSCEPRSARFEVLNPFVPSEKDTRRLGSQLIAASLVSKLGIPMVSLKLAGRIAAGIFLLALLLFLSTSRFLKVLSFLVPGASLLILIRTSRLNLDSVFYLWILLVFLALGALVASVHAANRSPSRKRAFRQPESSSMAELFILALVLLAGAALRFYGLNFGLPDNYHPDEVPKVNAIMRMVQSGTLNPEYFLHPSLLLYSSYALNQLFHIFGMSGEFRDTAFLAGRTVSAIAGTLSIYFVFIIGRRLYSNLTGVLAAGFLAVFPLHVTCSRYMKEDALLVCIVLLAVVAMLKAVKEDRIFCLYISGLLAGVSASTKYSGLLSGAIVILAPWLRSGELRPDVRFLLHAVGAVLLMPIGFLIFTPYSLITYQKFLKDFRMESRHMERGHTIPIDAWSQFWMYHFSRSIVPGVSLFATFIGFVGAGVLLWRRRVEDLFILSLFLLFYLPSEWVKAKPAPQAERYILPCIPVLAIFVAECFVVLWHSRLKRVVPLLLLLALGFPLYRSMTLAGEIKQDTRIKMAKWMSENIPKGSKVYLDWKPYTPRFSEDQFQVTYIPRAEILQKLDLQSLKLSGQDYLVLSSLFYERYFTQPHADAALRHQIRSVFEKVPVVKEIAPVYGTYGFHNPTLTVFSLKADDFLALQEEIKLRREGKIEKTSNQMRASFRWGTHSPSVEGL